MRGGAAMWLVLLAVVLSLLAPALGARTVLDLDVTRQPVPLLDWGDYWIDPDRTGMAEELGAPAAPVPWQPLVPGQIHPLNDRNALWIRFSIPPAPDAERWYLEVPYPSVNRASLFTRDSAGQWVAQHSGDALPVGQWPVPHRHPLLPVMVSAEVPTQHLLRVENPHSFSAPLVFVSESYLSRNEQRVSLILGIYFGLAGLAVVLSVISAITLRDSAYGLYAACVALMGLAQAAQTGIGGLHLWPGQATWNDRAPLVLSVWAVGTILMFIASVVSLRERSRSQHALVSAGAVLALPLSVAIAVSESPTRAGVMAVYAGVSMALAVWVIVWAWRRGDRMAPWLLLSGVPVTIGSLFPLARILGLLPTSFLTLHGMQIGLALELPLVMVILMMRSQDRRENLRRIQGVDRIDPGTGLITEPVFQERARLMTARSQRLGHRSAMLVVDIANLEHIRREFGRRLADELPLRTAARLLSTARDIDSVARLSGQRYGMLVEGPLSPMDAAALGPRIVARCLMPFKDKPAEWVAQVRVAMAIIPLDGDDPANLLISLEHLLNQVPRDSRKAVFALADVQAAAG